MNIKRIYKNIRIYYLSMDISSNNFNNIKLLFGKSKKNDQHILTLDFDGRIKQIEEKLFQKLTKRMIYKEGNGGLNWDFKMNNLLKISVDDINNFLKIDNLNYIKKFWQFNELNEDIYSFISEKKISSVLLEEYNLDFLLKEESEKKIDKNFQDALLSEKQEKEYTYNSIYSIKDPKYNIIVNLIEERLLRSNKSFKNSNVLKSQCSYKVNLDFSEINEMDSDFYEYLGNLIGWLLEELTESKFILNFDNQDKVINSFKKLTGFDNRASLKNEHFILAEPVSILRRNFHKSDNEVYVKDNYAVTYLPKGELSFLYIPENFDKKIDGKLFIINRDFSVKLIGREVEGFGNTLCEGYYIENANIFSMTDIIFFKGEDIRLNKFYTQVSSKNKNRFDYLLNFYKEAINLSTYIDNNESEKATKIQIARYLFGSERKFETNQTELLEKVNQNEFEVEGLLYRSNTEHYPLKGGYNYQLLYWKYPNFNTIDFLVKVEKDSNEIDDKISPIQLPATGKDLYGKIIYYKSLQLKTGGYRNIYDEKKNLDKKIYTIVDFIPKGFTEEDDMHIANIPLNNNGDMIAKNPFTDEEQIISNNMIVEFSYSRIYEKLNEFKWTPIKINYKKTKQYKSGDIVYGTSETYANHLWNSFLNKITENMLKENDIPEEVVESSNKYYLDENFRVKKYPFQVFHNRIIKDNLIVSHCPAIIGGLKKQDGSLLDLAVGNGNDMLKWKMGFLKTVIGLDVAKENIESGMEMYKRTKRPKPFAQYIWGNSSKLIFPNFDAAMDGNAKQLMKKSILSKYMFDVVSTQFAIHYFFESEITLRIFLQNVTDNLKVGGYFIGTSFDGRRVFEILKGKKKPVEGFVDEKLLWKISKHYTAKSFNAKKANYGMQIDVFVSSIGISHKEYLVNYEYLAEISKEYGLEMVSITGFGDIYAKTIKEGKNMHLSEIKNMSDSEKEFSFLHNQFIFKKKENASDKVYSKLITLIEKTKKKNDRINKIMNSDKKVKLVVKKK